MSQIIYIALGGSIGAILRFLISQWSNKILTGTFPWSTLIVNLLGAFIMGILWRILEINHVSQNTRALLLIGLLGSFTTFSTFSLETFQLINAGKYNLMILNIGLSIILSITMIFSGYFGTKLFINS